MQYPTLEELTSWGIDTVSIHPKYANRHDTNPSEYVVCGAGRDGDRTKFMTLGSFATLAAARKAFPTAMLLYNPPPHQARVETDRLKR